MGKPGPWCPAPGGAAVPLPRKPARQPLRKPKRKWPPDPAVPPPPGAQRTESTSTPAPGHGSRSPESKGGCNPSIRQQTAGRALCGAATGRDEIPLHGTTGRPTDRANPPSVCAGQGTARRAGGSGLPGAPGSGRDCREVQGSLGTVAGPGVRLLLQDLAYMTTTPPLFPLNW